MTISRCSIALVVSLGLLSADHARGGQSSAAVSNRASDAAAVPQLVQFSGALKNYDGKPASGVVGVTFLLYAEEEGGQPLWRETQNFSVDAEGRYSVALGASTAYGLPSELFAAGQARWLAIEPQGLPAPARILLLSVPYAMKAGDAETLGGLPASAFLRAGSEPHADFASASGSGQSMGKSATAASTSGSGTVNYIPRWTPDGATLGNSVLFQSGAGGTAKIGVNKTTPAVALDVNGSVAASGSMTANGGFVLPAKGTATAAKGSGSQPLSFQAAAFSSSTQKATAPKFQWQAETQGNNTAAPGASLNLLYSASATPTETGLKIAGNGQVTFAPGQTFPGAGTLTGITAGTGLTGGGTSGKPTIAIDATKVPLLATANTFTAPITFASGQTFPGTGTLTGVTAGTGLTGGGTGTNPTIGIDATKVPLLNAANTFTGDQAVTGNLQASATVSGATVNATNVFNLGGHPFAFGSVGAHNSFLGFAGNSTTQASDNVGVGNRALLSVGTGQENTAIGAAALISDTTGSSNTALGSGTLVFSKTGQNNTAAGFNALAANTTGSNNTALGANSGPDPAFLALTNSTAIGANATVTASNSLVLGSINGVNNATADTLVGIGTTAPAATLDVHGNANFTGPITFASGQTFPGTGTITSVTPGTGLTGGGTSGAVTMKLDTSYSDGRYAQLNGTNSFSGVQIINNSVGIGIPPFYPLHVNGTIRAETGLTLGGNASLVVDAPGSIGGHFLVTADGLVGIRNPNPKNTLDVGGNISTNSGVLANNANISGPLTAGSIQIGSDTAMSAAPHMVVSGFVPGGLPAGVDVTPVFMIPSKNILITRMSAYGINRCSNGGDEIYTLYVGSFPLTSQEAKYAMTIGITTFTSDSGALSISVPAGTPVTVISNPAPSCGLGVAAGDIAISVEYVMQ